MSNITIPVGMVLPYAGGLTTDSGIVVISGQFLLCNGASLLKTDYPALWEIIKSRASIASFGAADGTHFYLPNLQGRFVRAVDMGAGRDKDPGGRTGVSGGNSGDLVGSLQAHSTKKPNAIGPYVTTMATWTQYNHTHSFTDLARSYYTQYPTGGLQPDAWYSISSNLSTASYADNHTHTLSGGDAETRPKSMYLHYIIKF